MTTANANQQLLPKQFHDDDEIDLRQVVGALLRRWTWLASGSAIGLFLSGLHLIVTKPVYQGEFQIVINQEGSTTARRPCSPKILVWLHSPVLVE